MAEDGAKEAPRSRGVFPVTRWSLISRARGSSAKGRAAALSELCEIYWRPLYSYARSSGYSPPDAEDLTQGFLAELLNRQSLERASERKGKLRSFLVSGFRKFLAAGYRRSNRQKRGGATITIRGEDLHELEAQLPKASTPEQVFEKQWMMTILAVAREKLAASYGNRGKGSLFGHLVGFLEESNENPSYAEVARKVRQSEAVVSSAIYRLRKQYRTLVRDEVADTVESEDQVDEELRYLCGLFGS